MRPIGLLVVLLLPAVASLNVVVWLIAVGKSHLDFTATLVNKLAERGHNVDMILLRMNPAVTGNGTNKLRRFYEVAFDGESPWTAASHLLNPFDLTSDKRKDIAAIFPKVAMRLCQIALARRDLMDWLKECRYDIGLTSLYDYCSYAVFHKADIHPVLSFNSMNVIDTQWHAHNLPSPPSYAINPLRSQITNEYLTFFDRIQNVLDGAKLEFQILPDFYEMHNEIFRATYGKNFPSVQSLIRATPIAFSNANELLEIARPISHQIKYIGGISVKAPKPLDQKFERILAKANRGVVLFSFGTQIPSTVIPLSIKTEFIRAFKKFPDFTFLWKHEEVDNDTDLLKNATNVVTVKWLPQTSLLYDDRVKAFITHMGLNSMHEAAHAGVPMLSIPLFADQVLAILQYNASQEYNTRAAKSRGIAVKLGKYELTAGTIADALKKLLHDGKMHDRSREIALMLAKKPERPAEIFTQWVEYTAEFKNVGELTKIQYHDFFVYYGLDVIIFMFLCGTVSIWLLIFIVGHALQKISLLSSSIQTQLRKKFKVQ